MPRWLSTYELRGILNAPPVKQALASRQMKSIYVDRLLEERL